MDNTGIYFLYAIAFILIAVLLAGLFALIIKKSFSNDKNIEEKPVKEKLSSRRYVRDVKVGDYIKIQSIRFKGGIGNLKCLNNDPQTKKILLQIHWSDFKKHGLLEYEKMVLDYNDYELKNFHLLNSYVEPVNENSEDDDDEDDDDDYDIISLQKKINDALDKGEFNPNLEKWQKRIDELTKK